MHDERYVGEGAGSNRAFAPRSCRFSCRVGLRLHPRMARQASNRLRRDENGLPLPAWRGVPIHVLPERLLCEANA
jgi:hypothetical protein